MQTTNVWVNCCFDVLHRGHIELLKFAKSQGMCLIVGIDTDSRVKSMKGENRPFNNEKDRQDQNAELMASYMDLSEEIELYTTEE